jgi:ABC-type transport system involved in multi-copper enzyme maturation permease subunit
MLCASTLIRVAAHDRNLLASAFPPDDAVILGSWILKIPAGMEIVPPELVASSIPHSSAGMELLKSGRLTLFGPMLPYDLIRLGRRDRYILVRTLYALLLLFLLAYLYGQVASARRVDASFMAEFGSSFFYWFMAIQFSAAILLTPAYTAGAVAEEKDRKTIQFLLTTDLCDREIILSKFAARFLNLLFLILAGLPVLSFAQFWGGVDPQLLLAGFAATILTLCSLVSLSLLNSVYASKARDAIVITYLAVGCYFTVGYLVMLGTSSAVAAAVAVPARWQARLRDFQSLGEIFNSGNVFAALADLRATLGAGQPLSSTLPGLLVRYAVFHGLLLVICLIWSLTRLRVVALKEMRKKERTLAQASRRARTLHFQPMIWKELFIERGLTFNRFGRVLIGFIVVASLAPALWLLATFLLDSAGLQRLPPRRIGGMFGGWWLHSGGNSWENLGRAINAWVRPAGTLVACLCLLAVGVRAAAGVTSEREKQTLDMLLTTPLGARSILAAKWLGSLASVRWVALWLGLIWTVGIASGGLDILILPWLVLACLVYAGFLASLGLWLSVGSRSTQRATLLTLMMAGLFSFAHWLAWPIVSSWYPRWRVETPPGVFLQIYGLTPPLAITWLSFRGYDFYTLIHFHESPWDSLQGIIGGLVIWSAGAMLLWYRAVRRFQALVRTTSARPRRGPVDQERLTLFDMLPRARS